MNQELYDIVPKKLERQSQAERQAKKEKQATIDICGISSEVFQLNLWKRENTFFITSLYEIDCILKERTEQESSLVLDNK